MQNTLLSSYTFIHIYLERLGMSWKRGEKRGRTFRCFKKKTYGRLT